MTGEMDQEWIVGAEATLERDAGNPLPNGWFVQKEDEAGCGSLSLISGRVVVTIDPVLAQIDSTSNLGLRDPYPRYPTPRLPLSPLVYRQTFFLVRVCYTSSDRGGR